MNTTFNNDVIERVYGVGDSDDEDKYWNINPWACPTPLDNQNHRTTDLIIHNNMGKDHPDADLYPEATGLASATVKVNPQKSPTSKAIPDISRRTPQNVPSNYTPAGSAPSYSGSGSRSKKKVSNTNTSKSTRTTSHSLS
jgi:hypothetical protein